MPKRVLQGVVTSDSNAQTITVSVERRFKHPVMQKTIRKSKKYRAHDENNTFKAKSVCHACIMPIAFSRGSKWPNASITLDRVWPHTQITYYTLKST